MNIDPMPRHEHRRTSIIRRAVFVAASAVALAAVPLGVSSVHATLPNLNESVSLASSTATPGTTVRVTATFTPVADLGNIRVAVNLLGTNGNGTLTFISSTSLLSNCSVDGTGRGAACDWIGAQAVSAPQQIVVDVNVGAGAVVGGVWTVESGSGVLGVAGTLTPPAVNLTIIAPPTTTAAAASSTTVVVIPTVGSHGGVAYFAAAFLLGGVALVGLTRRRGTVR
jgi:hypothetical protein